MKRALILLLLLALLAPAAAAEGGSAWETAEELFLTQLNDDIRRNDPDAHLYTGSRVVPGLYETFDCPDGCFAMVYASDDGSTITRIELFCEDVDCVSRRLDDVAWLAWTFGSRDSIQAVSDWCDRWHGGLCDALEHSSVEVETDPCECAAFTASARVYQNDAQVWWLRVVLTL